METARSAENRGESFVCPASRINGHTFIMVQATSTTPGDSGVSRSSLPENVPGQYIGKFELIRRLGEGGMGTVYLAHDPAIQRDVAIKVLSQSMAEDDARWRRFMAEARAAGQLSHPNVVAVFGIEEHNGESVLVMEYVKGGSVADKLQRKQRYDVLRATEIIADTCSGLAAAHGIGLIHRDVKPANLMLDENGTVKVADFGLVRTIESKAAELTQEGQIVGTPFYMSPEQCTGQAVDSRSDIYSLGATYYTLLAGESPYEKSGSTVQIILAHVHEAVPELRKVQQDIPPAVSRIIARAMAKLPDDRYQTCEDMQADLQAVLAMLRDKSSSHVIRYRGNIVNNREMLVLPSERPGSPAAQGAKSSRRPTSGLSSIGAAAAAPSSTASTPPSLPSAAEKTSLLDARTGLELGSRPKGGSTALLNKSGQSIEPVARSTFPVSPAASLSNPELPPRKIADGLRQEVFTLREGEIILAWPGRLDAAEADEIDAWLDLLKRKLRRSANSDPTAASPSTSDDKNLP